MRGEIMLAAIFSCLFALSALAQNSTPATQIGPHSAPSASPAKDIGPAPANTQQGKIIDRALLPKTRQTLRPGGNELGSREVILDPASDVRTCLSDSL
jgi:hypothetical protein